MSKHIAASGIKKDEWVNCPARIKCRTGGQHIENNVFQASKVWWKESQGIKKTTAQLTKEDVNTFLAHPDALTYVENWDKKVAAKKSPASVSYSKNISPFTQKSKPASQSQSSAGDIKPKASPAKVTITEEQKKNKSFMSLFKSVFKGFNVVEFDGSAPADKAPTSLPMKPVNSRVKGKQKLDRHGRGTYDPDNPKEFFSGRFKASERPDDFYAMAPEGYSGVRCFKCGRFLSKEEALASYNGEKCLCPHCGTDFFPSGETYLIDHGIQMMDVNEVKKSTWYHASSNPNWVASVNAHDDSLKDDHLFIHVGSRESSLMRAKAVVFEKSEGLTPAQKKKANKKFYLYELKLDESVEVSNTVVDDENDSSPKTSSDVVKDPSRGYSADGVTRYVNWYEDPGSMSLTGSVKNFSAVGKETFSV